MATGLGGEIMWLCPSLDDTGNGTTTLYDQSGNGKNGTLTNMSPASDWVADTANGGVRAIDHDGTNDYVLTSLTSVPTSTHSISMWAFKQSAYDGMQINQRGGGGNQWQMWLSPSGTSTKLQYWNGTTTHSSTDNVPQDAWVHGCVTRDGTDVKFYINGVLAGAVTASVPSASTAAVRIYYEGFVYSRGKWDDCRIFNRAITPIEVAKLASARGAEGPAVSTDYYQGLRRGLLR
tara:strand:- start:9290 stop:9991 length:702 start_codon:yes stop_codon:yes gene_type:complete